MPKISKLNFTRKCILMSVLSQEKNLILVNSFTNIPIVKLYTTNSYYENFIYTKIYGAFCLFINKDPNIKLLYLRVYDIHNYSMIFNMELKKEHINYFTQYSDNFYFMELRESLVGFEFNSISEGKNFYKILKEEPNKEILEQNEKAMSIKPKEMAKTISKVHESIKLKLNTKFQIVHKKGGGWFAKKEEEKFPLIEINDKKGEYLDLSIIPKIYSFLNNVEISDILGKMVIFTDKKLPKSLCQSFILKYDNFFDFNSQTAPLKIIEKDFVNILNKKIYIDILITNMINDMKMHEKLDIFKKEHFKRIKKKAGYKISKKRTNKSNMPRKSRNFSSSRNLSRVSSQSSLYESDTNSKNDMRSSISSNSSLSGLYNTNDNKHNQQRYKSKDKFTMDRESINELNTVSIDNMIDTDDDNDSKEAGFNYFAEDKKKKPVQSKKKAPPPKSLKKSVSSDFILGNKKDKSKKAKKKAEDLINFLGGDSVAIPEIDEDEGDNKNKIINNDNSNQIKANLYVNNNFKNKINMSSKSSLTGFLMTTNKLGKNKK